MIAGLLAAGILVTAMVAVGLWLMERAGVEPAARANGLAPDPTEETEVRERATRRSSILIDAPRDVVSASAPSNGHRSGDNS